MSATDVHTFLKQLGIRSPDPIQELMQLTLQCMGALRVLVHEKLRTSKTEVGNISNQHLTTVPLSNNEEDVITTMELRNIFSVAMQMSLHSMLRIEDTNLYYPAKDLIESFPNSRLLGTCIWLPLHWASLMDNPASTMKCLVEKFPGFLKQRDKCNNSGMEYAVKFNNHAMIAALSKTSFKPPKNDVHVKSQSKCTQSPLSTQFLHTLDPFTYREEEGQEQGLISCRNPVMQGADSVSCDDDACVIDLQGDYMRVEKHYEMTKLRDSRVVCQTKINEGTSSHDCTDKRIKFTEDPMLGNFIAKHVYSGAYHGGKTGGDLCDFRPDIIIEMFGSAYLPLIPCVSGDGAAPAPAPDIISSDRRNRSYLMNMLPNCSTPDQLSISPANATVENPLPPFSMCL